ncbi:MAG: hypothetical protein ACE3JK_07380 [Sporolactobacillus sp.]
MVPVMLQLAKTDSVPMELLAPGVAQELPQPFLNHLQKSAIQNGLLRESSPYHLIKKQTLYAIDPNGDYQAHGKIYHSMVKGFRRALIFQQNRLILTDTKGFGFIVPYMGNNLHFNNHSVDLETAISRMWLAANRPLYLEVLAAFCFIGLLLSNILLLGALSIILWMTKWTKISDIHSLKEAGSVVSVSAGIPTFVSLFVSLLSFNYGTMMLTQSAGLVLMIALVFLKTRFQDASVIRNHVIGCSGG